MTLDQLEELIEFTRGDIQHLVPQAISGLKDVPGVKVMLDGDVNLKDALTHLDRPLVHTLLRRVLMSDVELELLFTKLRSRYLKAEKLNAEHLGLMTSLAAQCFHNDYAWLESGTDSAVLAELEPESLLQMMMRALFAPLTELSEEQLEFCWGSGDPDVGYLLSTQVRNSLLETELSGEIPTLGEVTNETSERVQKQYQGSPYPRWVTMERPEPQSLPSLLESWSGAPFRSESQEILVPGCGTGQHPIFLARCFPDIKVTAVDLSLPSLAYGKRRAKDLGVTNIEFLQGDLLSLGSAESFQNRFGFVDAVGVLHHLEDPVEGCRALVATLADKGVIRVGLYSRIAREAAGIYDARSQTKLGSEPSSRELQQARRELLQSPLAQFMDFHSLHGFRDLVYPAQEVGFSIPEAVAMLEETDLSAFKLQTTKVADYRFKGESPTDWQAWAEFEERYPETFRGMYHFFASCPTENKA